MALEYTKYVWECLYNRTGPDGKLIEGYSADSPAAINAADRMWRFLSELMEPGESAVFVGCAFGLLMDRAAEAGIEVAGLDASPWIAEQLAFQASEQACWVIHAPTRVGVDDPTLHLGEMVGRVKFDWVIDEDAICAHHDDEVPAFLEGCEGLLAASSPPSNIVHFVTTLSHDGRKGDSGLNWKPLEEWEALAPRHTWVSTRKLVS